MLTISNFVQVLKQKYPAIKFLNGCISKSEKCVGVYARGNAAPPTAIGSKPSYRVLPVTMLIHWGENSDECEITANTLYKGLEQKIASINNTRVINIELLESCPTNIGRDDNNICEMTIRLNIIYERGN
jgi:hypothetical protein